MIAAATIITGITFAVAIHIGRISTVRSLHFEILSPPFFIIFLSPEITISIYIQVPFSLSQIIISSLLLGMARSVCIF